MSDAGLDYSALWVIARDRALAEAELSWPVGPDRARAFWEAFEREYVALTKPRTNAP